MASAAKEMHPVTLNHILNQKKNAEGMSSNEESELDRELENESIIQWRSEISKGSSTKAAYASEHK